MSERIVVHVLLDGRHVGMLEGDLRAVRLLYDVDPGPIALSVSMPTTKRRWKHPSVHPWVAGLFPENQQVLARWRAVFGVHNHDPLALLPHVGEDVAGAAQFVAESRLADVVADRGNVETVTDRQIGALLDTYSGAGSEVGHGRFSLAGAQAKVALQRRDDRWVLPGGAEPSTHILKLAVPGLAHQAAGEVLTMRTAAHLGLSVAATSLGQVDGRQVVVVERYDRHQVEGLWRRVHQEDLNQAAGCPPFRKYEDQGGLGAADCADLLRHHAHPDDVMRFVDAMVFNYLVKATDAHARNYSLLFASDGQCRLAPLYDLNSGLPYGADWAQHSAMRIGGEDRFALIDTSRWRRFADAVAVDAEQVRQSLLTMAQALPDAVVQATRDDDIRPHVGEIGPVMVDGAAQWCTRAIRSMNTQR